MHHQTFWIFSFAFLYLIVITDEQIIGTVEECDNEGQPVTVNMVSLGPCIKCFCKSGIVQCEPIRRCRDVEGCHNLVFEKSHDKCCSKVCLGCAYNGTKYESGLSWQDVTDPCLQFTCLAGVITKTRAVCHTPCQEPVSIPGKCCPVCPGCTYKGKLYAEGLTFQDKKDPCLTCRCKNGNIQCSKLACPVLNCPKSSMVQEPGDCCLKCKGTRRIFIPPGRCIYQPQKEFSYTNDQVVVRDACMNCTCLSGTIICDKKTCPRLKCRPEEVLPAQPGSCCPTCPAPKQKCRVGKRRVKSGRVWYKDQCTQCSCDDGATHCWQEDCSPIINNCPKQTHELRYVRGHCCPQCVEISATCVVFGDPHYRTFDGLLYTFQGICEYTLAQQCNSRKRPFSIRVQNAAWPDKTEYAYTDSVIINTRNLKVTLHQHLNVTVNDKAIELPYIKLGYLSIVQRGYTLVVTTSLGVSLIWDGLSYLEVTVSQRFKNKMCGLCGNYNGDAADDFTGRGKTSYSNAVEFGDSWRRGRVCDQANSSPLTKCTTDRESLSWILKKCSTIKNSSGCGSQINVNSYYEECIDQLCSCDDQQKCFCKFLLAFQTACNSLELFPSELENCV